MELSLVSFALCPYLERASLLLREKGVVHDVRRVELAQKPDWFRALSPRGRTPLLLVDGELVEEPDAIMELLEELHPDPPLHAPSPLGRARDRALSRYAAQELFPTAYRLQSARDEDSARSALRGMLDRLAPLEEALAHREYLSDRGARYGWADVALAPFGVRTDLMRRRGYVDITTSLPALGAWVARLLARPAVGHSLAPDFEARVVDDMVRRDSWVLANPGGLSA